MKNKWLLILSIVAVLALLVASCTTEPADVEDDELMVEDSSEEMESEEMESEDDVVDSSSDDDGSDAEDMDDTGAEEGEGDMEAESMEEMTDEEMLAFLEVKLNGQHEVDFILSQDKTYDEWVETLDRMIGYGADIDEDEKELIINWLLARKESMMEEEGMAEDEPMAMTDEEMIAFIEEKLDGKHDIDRVLNADKSYDEWVVTMDRMIGYGADIDEDEKELIIGWLLNR